MLALIALAGCKLVDQRTFERTPTAPSAAELARAAQERKPILTISFAIADANWRPALALAVLGAEAHNPNAVFDVVTPVPVMASRDAQDKFIKQGQDDAAMVAREIQANRVPPERVTVSLRGDPGNPPRQVQVFAH